MLWDLILATGWTIEYARQADAQAIMHGVSLAAVRQHQQDILARRGQ